MKNLNPQSESETLLRYARACGAMLTGSAVPSLSFLLAAFLSEPSAATRWLVAAAIFATAPAVGAVAMFAATVSARATRVLLLASGTIALGSAVILTFQVAAEKADDGRTAAEIVGVSCLVLSWLCAFLIASFTRRAIGYQTQPVPAMAA